MLGLQPTAGGLTARVGWLGLKVGGHLALPCIRQMNRVNSRSDFHDDSTTNIVRVLLLLLLFKCEQWRHQPPYTVADPASSDGSDAPLLAVKEISFVKSGTK